MQFDIHHWIGGEWVGTSLYGKSVNPATDEVIGAFAEGGKEVAVLGAGAWGSRR